MENRLAPSPVNHPLATSIIAAMLITLVITGSLLTQPWQKCASVTQSKTGCLQSEFSLMLTPTQIQSASHKLVIIPPAPPEVQPIEEPIRPADIAPSPPATTISLPIQVHIPQFPDFILPRPESEIEETKSVHHEVGPDQKIPDFVAYQMSAILPKNINPPLPRAPNKTPPRVKNSEGVQFLRFPSRKIIIQDGDNLWSISNRIYGAGRQYIQIFEANKDVITSPHRIFPGQVLALPTDMADSNSVTE